MSAGDKPGWPPLPYPNWAETCTTLHMWSQIIGKYRLANTPWVNHSWHATLHVTPRGLTTGPVHEPCGCFSLSLDVEVLPAIDLRGRGQHRRLGSGRSGV